MGMKLEAIREDRTRGGRSTYQCSYTIPAGLSGNTSQPLPGIREYRTDKEEPAPPPAVPILLQVRFYCLVVSLIKRELAHNNGLLLGYITKCNMLSRLAVPGNYESRASLVQP